MRFKQLIADRNLSVVIATTLAQQLLVASSTYSLARASEMATKGENPFFWFGLFLGCLILVYLPSSVANLFVEKWKQSSFAKMQNSFVKVNEGRIDLYRNEAAKEKRHTQFVREAWSAVETSHHYFHGALQTALNVFLNVMAIGAVIDGRFIPAYLISALVVVVGLKLTSKITDARSAKCQSARVSHNDLLIRGWDTLLIGNTYNSSLMLDGLNERREHSANEAVGARAYMEIASVTMTWFAMVPVMGLLCYIVTTSKSEMSILVAIFATLHRQILTLQNLQMLVSAGMDYSFIRTQIQGVLSSFTDDTENDLGNRIQSKSISVGPVNSGVTVEHLMTKTSGFSRSGRLTLRGANGAGKSSLLLLIKKNLAGTAFYLPAHASLIFSSQSGGQSTGQSLKRFLEEIATHDTSEVLLLDEWDANLDDISMRVLNECIEKLATERLVIEVRHRA